jgi:outer membrane beta-barrel protein
MEIRILSVLLKGGIIAGCLVLWVPPTFADADDPVGELKSQPQVIEPEVDRREPKRRKIDTEDFEIGGFFGLLSVEDFGANAVYGATLAYHVSESFFIEGAYGVSDTEETAFERLSGGAPLLTDDQRQFSYYNVSLGFNILPGEAFLTRNRAFNTSFYFIAGLGSTDFAGDNHFTVNFGFGGRVFPNDWLALRLDVRDFMFDIDILGQQKTTHNLQGTLGITIFF